MSYHLQTTNVARNSAYASSTARSAYACSAAHLHLVEYNSISPVALSATPSAGCLATPRGQGWAGLRANDKPQSEQAQLLEPVHPSVRSVHCRQAIASALHRTLHAERQCNSRFTDTELRCAGLRRRTCQQLLHYGQVCRIRVRLELCEQRGVDPALVRQRLPARRRHHGQCHSFRC